MSHSLLLTLMSSHTLVNFSLSTGALRITTHPLCSTQSHRHYTLPMTRPAAASCLTISRPMSLQGHPLFLHFGLNRQAQGRLISFFFSVSERVFCCSTALSPSAVAHQPTGVSPRPATTASMQGAAHDPASTAPHPPERLASDPAATGNVCPLSGKESRSDDLGRSMLTALLAFRRRAHCQEQLPTRAMCVGACGRGLLMVRMGKR